jgi:hypothetical protein
MHRPAGDALTEVYYIEKNANLVHKLVPNVRFGHELTIVNSGSQNCPARALWSFRDDSVNVFDNNPLNFFSSNY